MAPKSKLLSLLTGDHAQLAEHHLREGRKDKAAEAFARGGDYRRAVKLAVESGDEGKAVEYSLRSALGDVPEGYAGASAQQAGDLLAVRGHHLEAIPLLEMGGAYRKAAESALKLKQLPRAARLYERAQAWAEAGIYYERAQMQDDVLRVLELESKRLRQDPRARNDPATAQRLRETDLKRAEILSRLGRGAEGAALVGERPATPRAAQLLVEAGKHVEAIQAYLDMGSAEEARGLLPKVADADRPRVAQAFLRAGLPLEAGNLFAMLGLAREAAEAYEAAQDWARAAERWEVAREPQRAAQAFLRSDRPRDAARCFTAAGQTRLAAAAYAQAGDRAAAAAGYLQAGQPLDAARLLLAAGDKAQAARALMQLQPADAGFADGTLLLAPLLVEEGLFADALQRLGRVPADERSGRSGAVPERLYWEARALEGLGRDEEARRRYELLTVEPGHRDAARRLGTLGASPPAAPAPAAVRQPAGAPAELAVGDRLAGRYDILAELGKGGMGRVYKAHDRELGIPVAIKTLLGRPEDGAHDEERLLREVQICRRIAHPNVVGVFDLGRSAGGLFIIMEYLEGERLDQLIARERELPLARVKGLLSEIAAGLREAHALGVVHRDLKPSNVIVTPSRLKILDFGIARLLSADTRLTQTGFAVGSPRYMSPEQLQGLDLDGRSDLYSLGVLAYTLLAGKEPFQGDNPATLALQHLQEPPPDIRRLRSGLPAAWTAFLDKLLAKQPAQRYGSAQEVLDALAALPAAEDETVVLKR